jgi:hypothetical protein
MRRHGIRAIMARPRRVRTTDSRHDFPIAANLLKRNFIAPRRSGSGFAEIGRNCFAWALRKACSEAREAEAFWSNSHLGKSRAHRSPAGLISRADHIECFPQWNAEVAASSPTPSISRAVHQASLYTTTAAEPDRRARTPKDLFRGPKLSYLARKAALCGLRAALAFSHLRGPYTLLMTLAIRLPLQSKGAPFH